VRAKKEEALSPAHPRPLSTQSFVCFLDRKSESEILNVLVIHLRQDVKFTQKSLRQKTNR
jgi:hypothetical protein